MTDAEMTRLRLAGKVSPLNMIPDDEDEDEDTSILDAINSLNETIKSCITQQPHVDYSPFTKAVEGLQEKLTRKRKWRFDVVRNGDGEITTIKATEV